MAELKVGRRVFDINENDIILFNGACWMLTTKTIRNGYSECYPTVSKIMCEKFVKKNILVFIRKEKEYITSSGEKMGLYYYKFDMDKLKEFLDK